MKKIIEMRFALVILALIFSINLSAQESSKDVIITASGSGATLEDAKQSALRSATEQAFGAFISSKTEIFNDQVVADQMSSVSSGNIKSYEVLNEDQLPDGRWGTTIKAIVSVDKLTSFVQAKGVEIEIKGGLFALNIKQQMLNEEGEFEAVYSMVGLLHEPMQTAFDYTIKSGDPKSLDTQNLNWEIPLEVTATCNKNMDFCANYFIKTLRALSLTAEEVSSYQALNKKVFPVNVTFNGKTEVFNLRKERSVEAISSLISNWEFYTRLFAVQSGMDAYYGNGEAQGEIIDEEEWEGMYAYYGNDEAQLFKFSRSDNGYSKYYDSGVAINFPSNGQQAATFSWQDKRTLSQIEQMTGYKVNSRGVVSQFKYGGFVVFEDNGHGLVVAISDLGQLDWNIAKSACEELKLNGYSDWYLPSKEELNVVYVNLARSGVGGVEGVYWTSTEDINDEAWRVSINNGNENGYNPKNYEYDVRAVRAF
jgi:hypothetical protein